MWRRVVPATLGVFSLAAGSAGAQQPPNPNGEATDHFVTFAARVCDTYTDISANRARNSIQESLKDLGPDTNYLSGERVSPAREEEGALRCATDNVNGDNVEYIRFPDNVEHVYCFAYYVQPPPTARQQRRRRACAGARRQAGTRALCPRPLLRRLRLRPLSRRSAL
jgi:hypothetical protein